MDPVLEARLRAVAGVTRAVNADNKKKGLPLVAKMANEIVDVPRMPTGSPLLDIQLNGGWQEGCFAEIFGPFESGKSTLAYSTIAEYQRRNPLGLVLLVDVETSYDRDRGTRMGIDNERLIHLSPNAAEDTFKQIEQYLDLAENGRGVIGLIMLDSIAALETAADAEADLADAVVAVLARLLSRVYKKYQSILYRQGTVFLAVNQTREKIGGYGNPETTPGGNAPKFYSTVRVRTSKIKDITQQGTIIGQVMKVRPVKNRAGGGKDESELVTTRARGVDAATDMVKLGVKYGIVTKAGGWHSVTLPSGIEIKDKSEDEFLRHIRRERKGELYGYLYDACVKAGIAELHRKMEIVDDEPVDEPEGDITAKTLDEALADEGVTDAAEADEAA